MKSVRNMDTYFPFKIPTSCLVVLPYERGTFNKNLAGYDDIMNAWYMTRDCNVKNWNILQRNNAKLLQYDVSNGKDEAVFSSITDIFANPLEQIMK